HLVDLVAVRVGVLDEGFRGFEGAVFLQQRFEGLVDHGRSSGSRPVIAEGFCFGYTCGTWPSPRPPRGFWSGSRSSSRPIWGPIGPSNRLPRGSRCSSARS